MVNPVTITDLEAAWRPLPSPDERPAAQAKLDAAWAIVQRRIPTVPDRLSAIPATLDVALVRHVIVAMVTRVLDNPSGYDDEQIDDWRGRRADIGVPAGVLDMTADEVALLADTTNPTAGAGAWTVGPSGDGPVTVTPWSPLRVGC